jgi:hypothetical protein
MIVPAVAFVAFAIAAPEPPRVETLPNGQFRVTVARRGMSSEGFVAAILESRAESARRCQGRGNPIEIGSGQINALPNERWEMVSTFACEVPPPRLAPPPEGT